MRWLALLTLAASAFAQENLSFEEGLAGWTLEQGAFRPGRGELGRPVIDPAVARDGKASLRFTGRKAQRQWQMAMQSVACDGGQRVLLRVAAKCKALRQEGDQFPNANAIVLFFDAAGKRLAIHGSPIMLGDRDWVDLHVHALAPAGTKTARIGVFASMSGDVWFDHLRLRIGSADPSDAAARRFALEALKLHLERTYPFWGLRVEPKDLPIDPSLDMIPGLQKFLAPLQDQHVSIHTPQGVLPSFKAKEPYRNWNAKAIQKRVTAIVHSGDGHFVGRMGDVGYIALGNFQKGFKKVYAAIDKLADARAIIIDVRWNTGGDERLAWPIAQRFMKKPVEFSMIQVRDPSKPGLQGFGKLSTRRLAPAGKYDPRPVIVLQGPWCMSSTEGFLLVMHAAGHRRVGLMTRGASANPKPFPLYPGVDVWTSRWRQLTHPKGGRIEGIGLGASVLVEKDHVKDDPTLAMALEMLRPR